MSNFIIMNILDLLESVDESEVQNGISDFSCPLNKEIENFIHKNAIEFAKRKLSITYLLLDNMDGEIVGFFTASAFLLAQIGKNYGVDNGKRITGNELIGYANDIMTDIQHRIGGGIIYLDCEDKLPLKNFYIDKNHYKIFGERYSQSDGVHYLQMIRFF